jgi:hypothetical protein
MLQSLKGRRTRRFCTRRHTPTACRIPNASSWSRRPCKACGRYAREMFADTMDPQVSAMGLSVCGARVCLHGTTSHRTKQERLEAGVRAHMPYTAHAPSHVLATLGTAQMGRPGTIQPTASLYFCFLFFYYFCLTFLSKFQPFKPNSNFCFEFQILNVKQNSNVNNISTACNNITCLLFLSLFPTLLLLSFFRA